MNNHFSPTQTPERSCNDATPERQRIVHRVRSFVAVHFLFQDDVDLACDASMLDAGILDSLGVMELVAFLEDEYSITVEEHELVRENLDTLNGVAELVQRHLDAV